MKRNGFVSEISIWYFIKHAWAFLNGAEKIGTDIYEMQLGPVSLLPSFLGENSCPGQLWMEEWMIQ